MDDMVPNKRPQIMGQLIKEEIERQSFPLDKFCESICCEYENISRLFKKASLDTAQLGLISRTLNHDFFQDIVKNPALSGFEDKKALLEMKLKNTFSNFTVYVKEFNFDTAHIQKIDIDKFYADNDEDLLKE